jgi:hypothetical protein
MKKKPKAPKYLSIEAAQEFMKAVPHNQEFTVIFDKKDGTTRLMVGQIKTPKTSGEHRDSPEARIVFDMQEKDYRTVNMHKVRAIRFANRTLAADPEYLKKLR